MVKTLAYVMVQTGSGKALNAAREIAAIPGVCTAHPVTGVYDIICHVEADSIDQLASTVVDQIQRVNGVDRTETALVIHTD